MSTNGASLEDCHTNVFALTELSGLSWRCLRSPAVHQSHSPITSDPVLKAYGHCLQDGLMCTWRREPSAPPSTLDPIAIPAFVTFGDSVKQLWVFWYGDDAPPAITKHASALESVDEGSAITTGMSYDVRTLFFKAFHTQMEREFAKKGFVRCGRLFVRPLRQPLPGRAHLLSSYVLALRLSFSVHGGHTVCASLSTQRQPALFRLSARHIALGTRVPVIVAPWSLRGVLLPMDASKLTRQPSMEQQWDDWTTYHTLVQEDEDDEKRDDGVPLMVPVELDGVCMLVPSSLVCVPLDECPLMKQAAREGDGESVSTRRNRMHSAAANGARFLQCVLEEAVMGAGGRVMSAGGGGGEEERWQFGEPYRLEQCQCPACNKDKESVFVPLAPEPMDEDTQPGPGEGVIPGGGAMKEEEGAGPPRLTAASPTNREKPSGMELKRRERRKRMAYHRLYSRAGSSKEGGAVEEKESGEESAAGGGASDSDDCDRAPPSWADPNKQILSSNIYCNNDVAMYHYGCASPAGSSDDDNLACSPFTPIKVISPCTDCHVPSGSVDQLSEHVFNEVFAPGSGLSRSASSMSLEEKAREFDCYYNPTMRDEPRWMAYHNRRQGAKRKSTYPEGIPPAPISPDAPGSQETIPATSSPAGDPWEERRRLARRLQNDDSVRMRGRGEEEERRVDERSEEKKRAVVARRRKGKRKGAKRLSWPELDMLDVTAASAKIGEDMSVRVGPMEGRPEWEDSSSDDERRAGGSAEKDACVDAEGCRSECEGMDEGVLDRSGSSGGAESAGSAGGVGGGTMLAPGLPTDSVLSPPASNENNHMMPGTMYQWPRVGGPPSAGDPSMNHIYPTPPSVAEAQQFSPMGHPGMHGATTTTVPSHCQMEPVQPTPTGQQQYPLVDPLTVVKQEQPDWDEDERRRDKVEHKMELSLPEEGAMARWMRQIENQPVNVSIKRCEVPVSGRFSLSVVDADQLLSHRKPLKMPPDYFRLQNKLKQLMPRREKAEDRIREMAWRGGAGQQKDLIREQQLAARLQPQPARPGLPAPPPYNMGMMGGGQMAPAGYPMQQHPQHPQHPQYMPQQMNGMQPPQMGPPMYGGPQQQMMYRHGMPPPQGYGMQPGYGPAPGMHAGMQGGPMGMQGGMQPAMGGPMGMGGMGGDMYGGGPQYGQQSQPGQMRPMGMQMAGAAGYVQPLQSGLAGLSGVSGGGMEKAVEAKVAEGTSVVMALLLQDTVLDLHYDSVFDSCPICSCNTNIRARELGTYLTPHEVLRLPSERQARELHPWSGFHVQDGEANTCCCGFSAVRHRYLSMCAGLFGEDAKEATGLDYAVAQVNSSTGASGQVWFDSSSRADMNLLDLLRTQCQHHDMGALVQQATAFAAHADRALKPVMVSSDCTAISDCSEYVLSPIDAIELLLAGNAATSLAMVPDSGPKRPTSDTTFLRYFHPWGLQMANELREPSEWEWRGCLTEVKELLDNTVKSVRRVQQSASRIVEGPLTWRALAGKSTRPVAGDDDLVEPEPVPYVIVATEKEAIKASPQIVRVWEQLSLGPIDQPKDVLWVAVVPDGPGMWDKTSKYMDALSQTYERMRFGRHIPLIRDQLRDGCLRIGPRPLGGSKFSQMGGSTTADFLNVIGRYVDDKTMVARLQQYMQCVEDQLSALFLENDIVFERSNYREALALDAKAKRQAATEALTKAANEGQATGGGGGQESMDMSGPGGSMDGMQQQMMMGGGGGVKMEMGMGMQQQGGLAAALGAPPMQGFNMQPGMAGQPMQQQQSLPQQLPQLDPEEIPDDEPGTLPHTVVIYMLNPFSFGADGRHPLRARLSILSIMRAFNTLCARLPHRRRPQLQLEILPVQPVFDLHAQLPDFARDDRSQLGPLDRGLAERSLNDGASCGDALRATAMAVFSQSRLLLPDSVKTVLAKSMTKFGPASQLSDCIDELEKTAHPVPVYKLPSTAFHLAPPPHIFTKGDQVKVMPQEEQTLFVSYCLLGEQWLCASVTDGLGRMVDNCLINLKTNQTHDHQIYRYRQKTQILDAMSRLWTYILGVCSAETRNWRLVIGRLGRIGHGELRAWSSLLSKQSLKRYSQRVREACSTCAKMPACQHTPAIVSACLVSLQPEETLRIFPTYFTHSDAAAKSAKFRPLTTPDDASCTHIMVFPTNADIQLNQEDQGGGDDIDAFDSFVDMDMPPDNDMHDLMNDMYGADLAPQHSAGIRQPGQNAFFADAMESIENQPLATGFYVSTAPAGELPDWFWASCPSAKRRVPVHLKSSLHINTPLVHQADDLLHKTDKEKCEASHPLDGNRTEEVLRHVLETYNALSWLNVDVVTGERRSCLPIHMQALLRLYHSVARLVL